MFYHLCRYGLCEDMGFRWAIHRHDVLATFLKDAQFYGDRNEGGAVRHKFETSEIFVERSTESR